MSISTPSPQYQALGAVVTIGIYLYIWPYMYTAKLFQSGRNQAVLLPKDYRLNGSEVAVKHFGKACCSSRSKIRCSPSRLDSTPLNSGLCSTVSNPKSRIAMRSNYDFARLQRSRTAAGTPLVRWMSSFCSRPLNLGVGLLPHQLHLTSAGQKVIIDPEARLRCCFRVALWALPPPFF